MCLTDVPVRDFLSACFKPLHAAALSSSPAYTYLAAQEEGACHIQVTGDCRFLGVGFWLGNLQSLCASAICFADLCLCLEHGHLLGLAVPHQEQTDAAQQGQIDVRAQDGRCHFRCW